MFGLRYENIPDDARAFVFSVIICSILLVLLFVIYLLQLNVLYIIKLCRGERRNAYSTSTYFHKSPCKSVEDSIYFSEILPSADNLSNGSTIGRSRSCSTISTISDKSYKQWFPLNTIRKFRNTEKQNSENDTSVCVHLKFIANNEENKQHGKLHISIKSISSLPMKDYPRYTEAYLVLQLLRVHRSIRGRTETKIYENRTRNFRNTRDIKVDEHFVVDLRKNDIKNLNICITAFDQDIYTKPLELASVMIPLSQQYKEICTHAQGVEITSQLKQVPKNSGHLLVGLSYLPTSQRLSVNIVKAANLPTPKDSKETKIDLYAQLHLLTGVTGRSLKRKKLKFNTTENEPYELNGKMSFDITPNMLENITLLIILYKKNKDVEDPNSASEKEATDEKNTPAKIPSKDHCLGSVALGKPVSNHKGKKHWRMMTMAPRRVVTVWHSLK